MQLLSDEELLIASNPGAGGQGEQGKGASSSLIVK
jgi:hypothetical protein